MELETVPQRPGRSIRNTYHEGAVLDAAPEEGCNIHPVSEVGLLFVHPLTAICPLDLVKADGKAGDPLFLSCISRSSGLRYLKRGP